MTGCARLGEAAYESARKPTVWVPLIGAGLVQFDDMDEKLSKWGRRENPIFNNQENADDWSDDLQSLTWDTSQLTLLLVDEPWGERVGDWAVMVVSRETTSTITRKIKNTAERDRPLDQNDESFPSGHTSRTAMAATFGKANLRRAGHGRWAPVYDVAAVMTGWARVEAGKHYPSDVMVGWSIGNFIGNTAVLAFFEDPTISVDAEVSEDRLYFGMYKSF
ncbi:MAG: phosphatase PAP2 family protein [Gammaproteobacteria bacterium]